MKTGIILLARMGATRLPGKVLKKICGKTVLEHVIYRLQKVEKSDTVAVATSVNQKDNEIAALCEKINIAYFRGNEENVLKRSIDAVDYFKFDTVITIGADSPVTDREVISEMLKTYINEKNKGNNIEYLSNYLDRSYPIGLDGEIFHGPTFKKIEEKIKDLPDEERKLNEINVVPFLHQHPEIFKLYSFTKPFDYTHLRWTLDTPEDFELITKIYEALYPSNPDFVMNDILKLIEQNPDWTQINSKIIPKTGYWTQTEQKRAENQYNKKI